MPDAGPCRPLTALDGGSLHEQVANGGDEGRMSTGSGRPRGGQTESRRGLHRLGVKVEHHFHMVGDEADRREYHGASG
jgi:hypothetical protein